MINSSNLIICYKCHPIILNTQYRYLTGFNFHLLHKHLRQHRKSNTSKPVNGSRSNYGMTVVVIKHVMRHDYVGFLPLITVMKIITRPDTLAKTANAIIAESLIISMTGMSRPRSFRSSMHGRMYASNEQPTAPENSITFNSYIHRVIS